MLCDASAAERLRALKPRCEVLSGETGLIELARRANYDIMVGALVGFAGLASTAEAIRQGTQTLRMSALGKLLEGVTTTDEVIRVSVAD
mgnify:CR=1 FL=1